MPDTPLTDQQLADIREEILAALSTAGAYCGECGFEPGETGCSDCVRVRELYADALTPIVERLTAERDELLTELDGRDEKARKRWIKNQEKQLGIKYTDFRAGRWEMDLAMGREMAAAYVAMAKTLLGDAPNYSETKLEFDVKIAESPETYTLVVQRHAPGALTPHEARRRAEAEVDRLRAERNRYRSAWRNARCRAQDFDSNATIAEAEAHQYRTALQGATTSREQHRDQVLAEGAELLQAHPEYRGVMGVAARLLLAARTSQEN